MKTYFVTVMDSFYIEAESEEQAKEQCKKKEWFNIDQAEITVEEEK